MCKYVILVSKMAPMVHKAAVALPSPSTRGQKDGALPPGKLNKFKNIYFLHSVQQLLFFFPFFLPSFAHSTEHLQRELQVAS